MWKVRYSKVIQNKKQINAHYTNNYIEIIMTKLKLFRSKELVLVNEQLI